MKNHKTAKKDIKNIQEEKTDYHKEPNNWLLGSNNES